MPFENVSSQEFLKFDETDTPDICVVCGILCYDESITKTINNRKIKCLNLNSEVRRLLDSEADHLCLMAFLSSSRLVSDDEFVYKPYEQKYHTPSNVIG